MQTTTKLKPLEMVKILRENNVELFADDNGHSWHKSAVHSKDWKTIAVKKTPSIVGDAARNKKLDLDRRPVSTYGVAGVNLVCSPELKHPLDIRIGSYQSSAENQALVASSIDKMGMFDKNIILGTTTPIGRQFSDSLIEEIKTNYLSRPTFRLNDDLKLQIDEVITYGEGLMAVYDWIILDDGKVNKEAREVSKILVIDIGGGTTDVVSVFSEGKVTIDKECTDTIEGCGIIDIYREVRAPLNRAISSAFKEQDKESFFNEVDTAMIDEVLKDDGVWVSKTFGIKVDVSDQIRPLREKFVREMMIAATRIANNINRYDQIIFVGGGSLLLRPELKATLPNAVYLNEFANAKGLLKVMTHFWLPKNFDRIMQSRK